MDLNQILSFDVLDLDLRNISDGLTSLQMVHDVPYI